VIIRFPTGLYDLPSEPSDSRSVSFVISTQEPPRTDLLFPKVPQGIKARKRVPKTITLVERRGSVGDLAFSVSRASRVQEGNNAKQFETGQILSFGDAPLRALDPMVVAEKTETQHDLNKFDYESLGITDEEQQLISDTSLNTHDALMERLNQLKQTRADAEVEVNTQQKIVNEANRNIEALEVIADSSAETSDDVLDLIDKLKKRRQEALNARDIASTVANQSATESEQVVSELRTVATVLK
jgi:hypothetical protein